MSELVRIEEILPKYHEERKFRRGERNNNPGNLVDTPQVWQGEIVNGKTDSKFMQFTSAVYGIRAMAKLLLNYEAKYGINTVLGIVERFAPRFENETEAYAKFVADYIGVGITEKISVRGNLRKICEAIILVECDHRIIYKDSVIAAGIAMALGQPVLAPDKPVVQVDSRSYIFCAMVKATQQSNDEEVPGYELSVDGVSIGWASKTLFEKYALYLTEQTTHDITFCEVAAVVRERKSVQVDTALMTHVRLNSGFDLLAASPYARLSEDDELQVVDAANLRAEHNIIEMLEFVRAWATNGV